MNILKPIRHALVLLGLSVLSTGALSAQTSFGGGSFEGGSFDNQTQPAPQADAGNFGNGFGGSFGNDQMPAPQQPGGGDFGGSFGAGDNPLPTPTPGPTPQPTVNPAPDVGGSDFGGGSFDPGFVVPEPAPDQGPGQPAGPQPDIGNGAGAEVLAFESRDFGIAPVATLRPGQFHAATPTAVPGGQIVSTAGLAEALNGGVRLVLIDVLGDTYSLPNAIVEPALASPGSLDDRFQQQVVAWLGQITGGQTNVPIVVYCSDPMCWLSYNGALRVIGAGYTNVYWYRGGLTAWQMAGYKVQPAAF